MLAYMRSQYRNNVFMTYNAFTIHDHKGGTIMLYRSFHALLTRIFSSLVDGKKHFLKFLTTETVCMCVCVHTCVHVCMYACIHIQYNPNNSPFLLQKQITCFYQYRPIF